MYWVVRESVRKALARGDMKFETKEELLESAKKIAKIKYDFDNNLIYSKSKLLSDMKSQTSLRKWF